MVGVPFDIIGISYDKYLMSIGVMDPSMYSAILFNIFLTFFCFIFISVYDLHFSFIAWAYVIATALRAFTEIAFSWNTIEVQRTIRMPNYKIFEDWVVFLKLGIPGCVMVCSEWWAFEILTVFASILGANAVDAQTIIFQLSVLVFMFPYGVSVATASIVGNALGANEIDLAKQTGTMALLFIFAINICLAIGIIEGGPYFISTLTTDPGVIKTTSELLPFLSLFILLDGLQGVASGIMRGAGRQNLGAILGFFTYYAVGLPMAWILTFKFQLGVKGLMMGISFGTVIQSSVLLSVIFFYSSYVYEPIKH